MLEKWSSVEAMITHVVNFLVPLNVASSRRSFSWGFSAKISAEKKAPATP